MRYLVLKEVSPSEMDSSCGWANFAVLDTRHQGRRPSHVGLLHVPRSVMESLRALLEKAEIRPEEAP